MRFAPPGRVWVPRTKFVRPVPADDVVLAPDLVDRVLTGLATTPLTLISAQAGSGKTTLSASTPDRFDGPVAWARLDEMDDDAGALVDLLVAALSGTVPGGCPMVEDLLASGLPAAHDPRRTIGVLVNDLVEAGPAPFAVVLDDLHVVRDAGALAAVDYLVAHLPASGHLLVTTRVDPPLALARLRATGALTEVRAADLRFTAAQAGVLLNERLGLGLDHAAVERLVDAAAGWVTGLRLLATSPSPPVAALEPGGDRRTLDAYLAAEVLAREPAGTQRFLLETAVLDGLVPGECAALTGRADAAAVLAGLHRRHPLLVLATGPASEAYRYHDLLRSFLRRHLAEHDPAAVPDLHRRAAAAVEAPARRVDHLLAAGAWDEAADAVEALVASPFPAPAELQRLAAWVRRLPPGTVAARPTVALLVGLAAVQRGDMSRGAASLAPVLEALGGDRADADDDDRYASRWLAARSLHLATNDHARFGPLLARLEASPRFARLPAAAQVDHHVSSAYASLFAGHWEEAARRVGAAIDVTTATGDVGAVEVLAQHVSPLLVPVPGAVDRIAAYAAWTARRFPHPTPLVRLGRLHQRAFVAFLRCRLDEATAAVDAAGDLPERLGGLPYLRATLDWVAAAVAFARGDLPEAERVLRAALDDPRATDLDRDLHLLRRGLLARLLRQQGRRRELEDVAAAVEVDAAGGRYTGQAAWAAASATAQAAWAAGDPAGAASVLRGALDVEDAQRLVPFVVGLRLDLALALDAAGDRGGALDALGGALERARTWGIGGTIAAAGPEAVPLLLAARERGLVPSVLTDVLAALGRRPPPAAVPVPGTGEVLSSREVEVLRLLDAGASNDDIAARLVVSRNTVKTHVRNVMVKLGARSRGEAVATARRLHLLRDHPFG